MKRWEYLNKQTSRDCDLETLAINLYTLKLVKELSDKEDIPFEAIEDSDIAEVYKGIKGWLNEVEENDDDKTSAEDKPNEVPLTRTFGHDMALMETFHNFTKMRKNEVWVSDFGGDVPLKSFIRTLGKKFGVDFSEEDEVFCKEITEYLTYSPTDGCMEGLLAYLYFTLIGYTDLREELLRINKEE